MTGQLYEIAAEEVRRMRLRNVPDFDREDLVQEAALKVVEIAATKLDRSRPEREQRAYLGKTAHSAAMRYLRWRGVRLGQIPVGGMTGNTAAVIKDPEPAFWQRDREHGEVVPTSPSAEADAIGRESEALINGALADAVKVMTQRERTALMAELTGEELPEEMLALHPGTLRTFLHRARRKVRSAARRNGCESLFVAGSRTSSAR